jgi:hypothetical protein
MSLSSPLLQHDGLPSCRGMHSHRRGASRHMQPCPETRSRAICQPPPHMHALCSAHDTALQAMESAGARAPMLHTHTLSKGGVTILGRVFVFHAVPAARGCRARLCMWRQLLSCRHFKFIAHACRCSCALQTAPATPPPHTHTFTPVVVWPSKSRSMVRGALGRECRANASATVMVDGSLWLGW